MDRKKDTVLLDDRGQAKSIFVDFRSQLKEVSDYFVDFRTPRELHLSIFASQRLIFIDFRIPRDLKGDER